jgi:tetratricopeptide (TPR) repeat protein
LARRYFALASAPADRLYGDFLVGVASYGYGDLNAARDRLEHVATHDAVGRRSIMRMFERPLARAYLAPVLWLQGFPHKALEIAKSAVEGTRTIDHAYTLCRAVARGGCPVAFWIGNLGLAEHYIELLVDEATRHNLTVWRTLGDAYGGMLFIRRGDLRAGLPLLRSSLDELDKRDAPFLAHGYYLGELAAALSRAGQFAEGLVTIDDAIDRSARREAFWIMPELMRVKGELLALRGAPGSVDEAEACFRQALDWAERQNALSWQLRAAASLAGLLLSQGRSADAIACLAPIYDRFTEGFDTADLTAARALLDTLRC